MKYLTIFALILSLWAATLSAEGQDDQADQGNQDQQDQQNQQDPDAGVKVTSVTGSAEFAVVTADQDPTWKPVEAQANLPVDAVIRTGFRTKVVLQFPDGSTVTIDRATKVGISKLKSSGGRGQTQIGIKYGVIRAEVKEGQKQGDFEVVTPVATLSVAGSKAEIGYSIDNCMGVKVQKGDWQIQKHCSVTVVSDREWGDCYLTNYLDLVDYYRDSYMADGLGLSEEDKWVDIRHGTGRGWVAIPGSPFTVTPTRTTDPTQDLDPANP
ncbi:MAG: FecR domain-containing protein [Phycisphaerae bacterium]